MNARKKDRNSQFDKHDNNKKLIGFKSSSSFKVAFRVQICKKIFCQNRDKFIKNGIIFMYLLCIYKIPLF